MTRNSEGDRGGGGHPNAPRVPAAARQARVHMQRSAAVAKVFLLRKAPRARVLILHFTLAFERGFRVERLVRARQKAGGEGEFAVLKFRVVHLQQ